MISSRVLVSVGLLSLVLISLQKCAESRAQYGSAYDEGVNEVDGVNYYNEDYYYEDYYEEELVSTTTTRPTTTTTTTTTTSRTRPPFRRRRPRPNNGRRRTTTPTPTSRPTVHFQWSTTTTRSPDRNIRPTAYAPQTRRQFVAARSRTTDQRGQSAQDYLRRTEGEPISTSTNRPATTAAPPRVSASESQGPSTDMYPGTGNLIHSLGHPKEDHHCPEGWLIDVYGYCREAFLMERRDWRWWWDIRDFMLGNQDSGYGSS